ncbi:MAG: GEGP motif-containing diheme protein [Spirochaetota bacterium]|nr:GEGP motif-containing diheme protein [Spirochaetota bacterium]
MLNKLNNPMVILYIVLIAFCACSDDSSSNSFVPTEIVSSRAYSGHESDVDANNFVKTYPSTVGKRLDDCQTCHSGGRITYADSGKTKNIDNPCSYCHLKAFEEGSDFTSGYPSTYESTLNPYGLAYNNAGRNQEALQAIADQDSDSDTYSNAEEIEDLRFPGDADSYPGQPLAPTIELYWDDVTAMNKHEQFMLLNAHKQQYDDYVTYKGVTILDLIAAAGIDLSGATGMTFFAPDGYQKDFDLDEDINYSYPRGIYYSVPSWPDDPERNLINYPDIIPDGLAHGSEIPDELYMILAYERDDGYLDESYYDSTDGRIGGEGPYRIVRPQESAGRPDRGSRANTYGDGWDYDDNIDHNAGDAVKGTCVIRIDPMPDGYEEYDWINGWSLIMDKKLIVYGQGVTEK